VAIQRNEKLRYTRLLGYWATQVLGTATFKQQVAALARSMSPAYHAPQLVGPFDYAVLGVLLVVNAWYAQRRRATVLRPWANWAGVLLFGLVLPVLSIQVEMERTRQPASVPTDSLERLYTLFRFPGYGPSL
jgi:hypothetical protein